MHTDNVELESSSEVCDFADLYTIHEKRNATLPFHRGKKAFLKRKRDESGSATPAKPALHTPSKVVLPQKLFSSRQLKLAWENLSNALRHQIGEPIFSKEGGGNA